jgi:enamine deaminase RidA (YjgF/YER057c/UK114 family)
MTIQALLNIKEWLKAAKSGLHNVINCKVYLTDMADFTKVNEAYAKFF